MFFNKKLKKMFRKKIQESEFYYKETIYIIKALKLLKYKNIFLAL